MPIPKSSPSQNALLPTFLIIGSAKSGTTSLYHYLKQHPDVYMSPVKEPKFFIVDEGELLERSGPEGKHVGRTYMNKLADYHALFQQAGENQARGEASPFYLYDKKAPDRIKALIPKVELIAILRNPVERAYSAFLNQVRNGDETHTNFAAALNDEPERIVEGWSEIYHYRQMGFYYEQLQRYYTTFGHNKIHVYLYDDLKLDSLTVVQNIFQNIHVNENFVPNDLERRNISGVPKNKLLHQVYLFLKGSNRNTFKDVGKALLPTALRREMKGSLIKGLERKNLEQPKLDPKIRELLLESFREDILKLQDLLGRDLSGWLKP